jgi:lipopolysaccharide transport system ATP-binding protein
MSNIAIKVEDVGKLYRLGEVGTGTISHDLNRWIARMRGKEDPFAKVGEANDRTSKGKSDYVWALKDVNFEVQRGEVLGIIGRNGAGKSTLLKVLSKVTQPTTGNIKVNGRIASLLEVGTGFHPEMTGRENIFLNGAIMGMTKKEIKSKFDEIVDFAGVERYVDTPVKRYSSGMYVRLAFAVAAHLEPEILIVDEVLAVGDAEFQKKCLGKMKDVSLKDGRTVLFVSHDLSAIQRITNQTLLMNKGKVEDMGQTRDILTLYRTSDLVKDNVYSNPNCQNGFKRIEVVTSRGNYYHNWKEPIRFLFECVFTKAPYNLSIAFQLINENGVSIINPVFIDEERHFHRTGVCIVECAIELPRFVKGLYSLTVHMGDRGANTHIESVPDICTFEVIMDEYNSFYSVDQNKTVYMEDVQWNFIN